MEPSAALEPPAVERRRARYWRLNVQLTGVLLGVWTLVSFGGIYFARELSLRFFGWPLGFWLAAQGALIVYVLLVAFYAFAMGRLDREYAVDENAPHGL